MCWQEASISRLTPWKIEACSKHPYAPLRKTALPRMSWPLTIQHSYFGSIPQLSFLPHPHIFSPYPNSTRSNCLLYQASLTPKRDNHSAEFRPLSGFPLPCFHGNDMGFRVFTDPRSDPNPESSWLCDCGQVS